MSDTGSRSFIECETLLSSIVHLRQEGTVPLPTTLPTTLCGKRVFDDLEANGIAGVTCSACTQYITSPSRREP